MDQRKLTIFGATGRVGGHLVRQALDAGHQVTAVVREASRFEPVHPALTVARVPGVTGAAALRPAVDASDAVLSAIGPRGRKGGPVAAPATTAILEAMEGCGVRRLVAVSAMPLGPRADGESLLNRAVVVPLISAFARQVFADLAVMEERIERSGADWTVVRPPRFTDGPETGAYRTAIGGTVPRGYSVSTGDVAHAMLAALDDPATSGQGVGLAY